MNVMEIFLIVIGFISLFIGFFVGNRKTEKTGNDNVQDASLAGKIAEQTIDILETKKEQVIAETEEYLNRKSNEKIMEFEEYSSQILEKIERNHEEVVFMYQMLTDKEEDLKQLYASKPRGKEQDVMPAPKTEQKAKKQKVQKEKTPLSKQSKDSLNERMIELHRSGKSVLEISKLLHVGQGEVQLILSLYDK